MKGCKTTMLCDDCELETGVDGNHATDAECMQALMAERSALQTKIETLRDALNRCSIIGERGVVEIATDALVKISKGPGAQ